jgi:hypothetical protein
MKSRVHGKTVLSPGIWRYALRYKFTVHFAEVIWLVGAIKRDVPFLGMTVSILKKKKDSPLPICYGSQCIHYFVHTVGNTDVSKKLSHHQGVDAIMVLLKPRSGRSFWLK